MNCHYTYESKNKDDRRADYWSCIVIHHITLPDIAKTEDVVLMGREEELEYFKKICDFLCSTTSKVSAHYLIGRYGQIAELVDPKKYRAWHAGKSAWWDSKDRLWKYHVNNFGIGIELIGDGNKFEYTKEQYYALELLCRNLILEFKIPHINCLVGHETISNGYIRPDPKPDPGIFFRWNRIYFELYKNLGNEYGLVNV